MPYLQQELAKLMNNDRQREAYLYDDNCVVQAGPGSGKTAVLTLKVMRLLAERIPPPRGLACLTFNNEAVREFKNRLRKLGLPSRPNVFLGTVHSFCLSCVIRPFGRLFRSDLVSPLRVASDAIRRTCLQQAMDYVGITEHPAQFQSRFERYRRTYLDRTNREWLTDEDCANAIERYESLLHQRGCVDFDDLILVALTMIKSQPLIQRCLHARYPWLVIDEYQDLGYPLHQIVLNLIANTDVKIFAVGDSDQSIYGFTGADPKYLRELADRADVKSIRLSLNYRCGQKIIDGAEVILCPPTPRGYMSSRGGANPGEIHFIELSGGLEQQADAVAKIILPELKKADYDPKEIAILHIDRNDASVIVKALEREKVKYAGERDQRYRRTPVTRWVEEIAQWCCGIRGNDGVRFGDISNYWIRLLRNTETAIAEETLLLHITSFLGCLLELQKPHMLLNQWLVELDRRLSLKTKLATLREWPDEIEAFESMVAACADDKPLKEFTVADLAGCGPNARVISFNTLHSSKGLEFDVVIIPGLEEGRLPRWGTTSEQGLNEARRTFYVAFTRARHLVFLLYSGWYQGRYGRRFPDGPSRFILELQESLGYQDSPSPDRGNQES